MNDEIARAHQEIATRNSRAAIDKAESTHDELLARIVHLDQMVAQMTVTVSQLEQKYNLLLTARFDGRATTG